MCKITEVSQTLYECPYCHYQFGNMKLAMRCMTWHDERKNVISGFEPDNLNWYVIKVKNGKTIEYILPYKINGDGEGDWGWRNTCCAKGWQLYDLNYNYWYTQNNWEIVQVASLEKMWEQKRILPHMKNIIENKTIQKLNDAQKQRLMFFWNNTVCNEDIIYKQLATCEYTKNLDGLLKLATNVVRKNYFYSGVDPMPEFNDLMKKIIEKNYRIETE